MKTQLLFLLFTALLLSACAAPAETPDTITTESPTPEHTDEPEPPAEGDQNRVSALVVKVVDGDTIDVEIAGEVRRIRYIGMDTPERGDPYFKDATDANKRLVLNRSVELEKDVSETDRFGRALRYVYADGLMINAELVKQGFAQASTYPPDVKHQALFSRLEREARSLSRGLWTATVAEGGTVSEAPEAQPEQETVCDCSGDIYNCSSFETHKEAQACFLYCGGTNNDIHRLDRDNDGSVCESKP